MSFIAAIILMAAIGLLFVNFIETPVGSSCLSGCVMLVMLVAIGGCVLFFGALLGAGCMATLA